MEKVFDFDIEANDYLKDASTIWCMVGHLSDTKQWIIYHVDTEEAVTYPKNSVRVSLEDFIGYFDTYTPSAYNGLGYDFPLLNKLHSWQYITKGVIDPLIMSRLSYPDRAAHSIQYWGELFKMYKGDHNDFSRFSNEMLQYCVRDTAILIKAREFLEKEMAGWDWSQSLELEKEIQYVQTKQELKGVLFDAAKAEQLLNVISEEIATIEEVVIKEIPMSYKDEGEVRKVFKKNGEYFDNVKKWIEGG